MEKKYKNLSEFYPFYLTEHQNLTSRILHFIGTSLFLIFLFTAIYTRNWFLLIWCPIVGYGFAWVGHFFFEKNKPATFTYPLMSLTSDFIMFWHIVTGQISSRIEDAKKKIRA